MSNTQLQNAAQGNESAEYIKVGMSTCGIAAGADVVYNTFQDAILKRNLPVTLSKCGCIGMCYAEPLIEVKVNGLPVTRYGRVNKEVALYIIEKHLVEKQLVNGYIYDNDY
jgi:NADP-reducing hydrogenase subunit HndB